MQLADLAAMVTEKVGKLDDASLVACKNFIRQRHEMVVDSYPWKDTIGLFEVPVSTDSPLVVLPFECGRPWAVWDKDAGLDIPVTSLTAIIQTNPKALENLGGTLRFTEVESVGVPWQLEHGEIIGASCLPGSVADKDVVVGITGLHADNEDRHISQSMQLLEEPASFPHGYSLVLRISKPTTADRIRIWRMSDGSSFDIPAGCTECRFARIRLISPARADMTLGLVGKRKLQPMVLDTDSPMVRGIDNALLAFAQGDMLERSRQYQKAAAKNTEGSALIEGARDLERNQSAKDSRILPLVYREEGEWVGQW